MPEFERKHAFLEKCELKATIWQNVCKEYRDYGYWECEEWRDERVRECKTWAKEYECCDWAPCSWVCSALVWLGKWVCILFVWVVYSICVLWGWVPYIICVVWGWVKYTICVFLCIIMLSGNEQSFHMENCGYGWDAAYRIEDYKCELHITIRIKLDAQSGVSQTDLNSCSQTWKSQIESTWSNQFQIGKSSGVCNCEAYSVDFSVDYVESDEHHTVKVHNGTGRANMTNWYINGGCEDAAAHEFGHMLGFLDEYPDPNCPDRDVTDNSIMKHSSSGTPQIRHYEPFAEWISRRSCCTYEVSP